MTTTVTRRLIRTAYPRNGNVHNPTKYYAWDVTVNGRVMFIARTMREAKAMLPAMVDEYTATEPTS